MWRKFVNKAIYRDEDINKLSQSELYKVYEYQMKFEGFTRSLLSTAKNFNLFNTRNMYKELGKKKNKKNIRYLGSSDEIVSIEGLDSMKRRYLLTLILK